MRSRITHLGVVTLLVVASFHAHGATIERSLIPSLRHANDGQPVSVLSVLYAPENPRIVLIHLPPGDGTGLIVHRGDQLVLGMTEYPLIRIRERLVGAGVALLMTGVTTGHLKGFDYAWRRDDRHAEDIGATVTYAKKRFPRAKVYLATSGDGLASLLVYAVSHPRQVDGYLAIGGSWYPVQNTPFEAIKEPFLVLHAANDRCAPAAGLLDAREAVRRGGFTLVEAGYADVGPQLTCEGNSHHALAGLDRVYAGVVLTWLDGGRVPARIGDESRAHDLREEIHAFRSTNLEGQTNTLQLSLFLPPGDGPFPLVVFNHGDVAPEEWWQKEHLRSHHFSAANAFLRLNVAVAFPDRAGIGKSEGRYYYDVVVGRAPPSDPLLQPTVNSPDILAAVAYLRKLPTIDRNRIVLAGTSAGGMASVYIASRNPAWLRGVINFAGGSTDAGENQIATGLNNRMVSGFARLGMTAKAPMLWIFAANDSRFSKETVLASHEAFVAAGGKAKLRLFPPLKEDGHRIAEHPEVWASDVAAFLKEVGLTSAPAIALGVN